ncbi:MAG: tRNA (uridine(34)/cytosine(34)/5-carboxymethylaminomethyluridine(34)-2'-O)-methyltransferase TrmL [Eubacteriales bacterium]|nr:tRNA (uridine(34)/cytosine(34)/5-carboxymethylaminomethyluridine(34)-2'-O)-methyltransferase TrmL [Eubacteriales bacterium]MDD3881395.1 tRNA (uridine(34)/cytosine(34)/5-carboxymethylaminomethyluridine(34)-2'-O)-methyltransferase TrmL [Eubacteriales bacterium]MDD4513082.1 tRNA (uridine(34)/cytosine(34)/5-carboxymethylaminomethyluridine(34)-2'-O)-methyltransferase TrmL [Eubacteriales bacterium]
MRVCLIEPEIPQNTGNIARTCAATGSELHLVKPLGFEISDKYLKRAGLDYWKLVKVVVHESAEEFFTEYKGARMFAASTKATKSYCDFEYRDDDFLVFGKETRGLPENIIAHFPDTQIRIPMIREARSLNLSNSVAIVLYEALRQQGFKGLVSEGMLTGREEAAAPWLDYL